MAKFRCLGVTVRSQDYIHEDIISRLNLKDIYYCWVQNLYVLLSFLKTEICKTVILLCVLYGYEILWLVLIRKFEWGGVWHHGAEDGTVFGGKG
jgi:hypothetical protein